jgi:hypothetical protein
LRELIARRAFAERRTFSGQVVVLLEAALDTADCLTPRERALVQALEATFDATPVEEIP